MGLRSYLWAVIAFLVLTNLGLCMVDKQWPYRPNAPWWFRTDP